MLDVLLIHKLFNQTVMGKQAFVKAYVCFQTTASPRPFDYEYKNIRLLYLTAKETHIFNIHLIPKILIKFYPL